MIQKHFIYLMTFLAFLQNSSCITTKNASYINNAADATYLQTNRDSVVLIQKNDILSIAISSLNPEASAIFNTTNNFVISASTASGTNTQSAGYLVNADGYIQLPILGNIKADGMSKKQLKDNITNTILEKKLLIELSIIFIPSITTYCFELILIISLTALLNSGKFPVP